MIIIIMMIASAPSCSFTPARTPTRALPAFGLPPMLRRLARAGSSGAAPGGESSASRPGGDSGSRGGLACSDGLRAADRGRRASMADRTRGRAALAGEVEAPWVPAAPRGSAEGLGGDVAAGSAAPAHGPSASG